jgi:hypothetical protein
MIAIDTCFNNTDRFPTIWKQEGSSKTFQFKVETMPQFKLTDTKNLAFNPKETAMLNLNSRGILSTENCFPAVGRQAKLDSYL